MSFTHSSSTSPEAECIGSTGEDHNFYSIKNKGRNCPLSLFSLSIFFRYNIIYQIKKGESMKAMLYGVIVAGILVGINGCTGVNGLLGSPKSDEITKFMDEYKTLTANKALAYTKNERGQYVFGNAFDYSSQEEANNRALKQCESRRIKLGVEKECVLLAEGDKFLERI